jgi:hypothetical protein
MTFEPNLNNIESLKVDIADLIEQLPDLKHQKLIQQAMATIVRLASSEIDRLDWKILSASLVDMEQGFQLFNKYQHVRKVTIFGSARTPSEAPEYLMAADFARCVTKLGFMVMTGLVAVLCRLVMKALDANSLLD